MPDRFNMPRLSPAGEERVRRAMERGHPGDDPNLAIRKLSIERGGDRYVCWLGPVDYDGREEALWEMEINLEQFSRDKDERR